MDSFVHHHYYRHGRRDDEKEGQQHPPFVHRPNDSPYAPPLPYDCPGCEGYYSGEGYGDSFVHHHYYHHGRRDDEKEGQRHPPFVHRPYDSPYTPPSYGCPGCEGYYSGEGYGRPAYSPQPIYHGYESPRPYHGAGYVVEGVYSGGHYLSPSSSEVHHVVHGPPLPRQPTVRIFTKASENHSLSIRDGQVVLARANPNDHYQHWIKVMRYATKVKDEEGFPSFALVNKVTGQAIKHSTGATHPVRLVPYKPDYLDESVLWAESADTGEGFRCIRMINNIRLNFDAFHGDEDHGGVHDGTTVVLWEWLKGKNQRWKIVPYCEFLTLLIDSEMNKCKILAKSSHSSLTPFGLSF